MEQVKKLREMTGAGIMDCKRALEASGGDIPKAATLLREKGIASAVKREAKEAREGLIGMSAQAARGAMIELNCETDFVARTDDFIKLAETLTRKDLEQGEGVLEQEPVLNLVRELSGKVGEKMVFRRANRYEAAAGTFVSSYLHSNKRIGVLVLMEGPQNEASLQCGKDIAMQVAAARARFVSAKDVPAEMVEEKKRSFVEEIKNKPREIQEKIAKGKLEKWFNDICLLDQSFIKNEEQKVSAYLAEVSGKIAATVKVVRFVRIEVGVV